MKLFPKRRPKGVKDLLVFNVRISLIIAKISYPFAVSKGISPKNDFITTVPKALWKNYEILTSRVFLSSNFDLLSNYFILSYATLAIRGILDDMKSKLNTLLKIFFFFFQFSPSLRKRPSPAIYFREDIPGSDKLFS